MQHPPCVNVRQAARQRAHERDRFGGRHGASGEARGEVTPRLEVHRQPGHPGIDSGGMDSHDVLMEIDSGLSLSLALEPRQVLG